MACSRIVFLTLVLSVVSSFAVQVPVFLWGDRSKSVPESNPHLKVSSNDFRVILKHELQDDPFTVVFIEETLSVEDFSRKDAKGETSFQYLKDNVEDSVYLPSVENPLSVLNKLADPKKVYRAKLTEDGLSGDFHADSGKFLFINLKDAREGETRADMLLRHDDFIGDLYAKLQEDNSVVAIYTAHFPSWTVPDTHSRVRRQANETQANGHDYTLDGLRLYVQSIDYGAMAANGSLGNLISSSTVFDNNNTVVMNTTMQFSAATLTLNFRLQAGYWFFDTVTFQQDSLVQELAAKSEVYALDGFAYRCGERISFAATNETEYNVTFIDMKVQPFFKTLNASDMVFGDSFNCVGFFTVPIWSGLFVVFILLSITFYGIMMMLDIRTMDRFDDPKGKTITINASD
ncbi:hypothetical protein ABMA27_012760 [Loxostege sticticalis]|uniref:V-type proton ATPase subunit S1 n=1 Tax=Loxostege sticticalis TaxID=481309 RepID=A0ABR3GZQ7_LOXSC